MTHTADYLTPQKVINLTTNSGLLAKARGLKRNLSVTPENALTDEVRKVERMQWLEKNQEAIDASNQLVAEKGLFADSYRVI